MLMTDKKEGTGQNSWRLLKKWKLKACIYFDFHKVKGGHILYIPSGKILVHTHQPIVQEHLSQIHLYHHPIQHKINAGPFAN
ncbi:hypothetical protein EUGRSUZ_E03243 [Eucalyptus grandis]|uniref:Uncharacterized protein n=2 Tax=Eucalyptus grandis TaxID=71139 RepID=A0ACC3KYU5_EUCGR|nr:hypothetical protein EUGRSUZ_E03243 [Eucalyptus grandis]